MKKERFVFVPEFPESSIYLDPGDEIHTPIVIVRYSGIGDDGKVWIQQRDASPHTHFFRNHPMSMPPEYLFGLIHGCGVIVHKAEGK